jgi:hypothetical protein
MAVSFLIGKTLVDSEELEEKMTLGQVRQFVEALRSKKSKDINFRRGIVSTRQVRNAQTFYQAKNLLKAVGFTPIGIGNPLGVEIISIYTGDAPKRHFLGGKPDLLVSSATKSVETYDASPRAVNQIRKGIKDKELLEPSALAEGSTIAYYTPVVDSGTILCSFELVADSINDEILHYLSRLFSTASGLPIFAPASAYLMAGSFITKVAGDLVKIFKSKPFLKEDLTLRFDTPDFDVAIARTAVLYNDRDRKEFEGYTPELKSSGSNKNKMVMFNKNKNKEYRGEAPYIVLSIDGRERKELKEFTAKLASASIIEKFYGDSDTGGKVIESLESALELYNDFNYRQKADRMKEIMNSTKPNTKEYEEAKKLFDAYKKNIVNDHFKIDKGDK